MSTLKKSAHGASSPFKDPESPVASGPRLESRRGKAPPDGASQSSRDDETAGSAALPHDENDAVSLYREQLMRDITSRGGPPATSMPSPKRPSPIQEELSASPSFVSGPATTTTTSTESANTVRGTPGLPARTPSYPFPPMRTPGMIPSSFHRPFTTLSPTGNQVPVQNGQPEALHLFDKVLSNPSTPPSSNIAFQPSSAAFPPGPDRLDFPSPSLYDLSLMLAAEPGVDAWWQTVVEITTVCFKAERVTLALPGDSTDLENVPWGQKATYSAQEGDDLSLGYMARGSSLVPSSTGGASEVTPYQTDALGARMDLARPGLLSRHSFTSYEDKKEQQMVRSYKTPPQPNRPRIPRSKSSYPVSSLRDELSAGDSLNVVLSQQALAELDAVEGQQPILDWAPATGSQPEPQGRVLPVLQALDFEADPLIDHNGVQRVLARGRVVALTRSYPYLEPKMAEKHDENTSAGRSRSPGERKKAPTGKSRADSTSHLSSLLSGPHLARGSRSGERKRTVGGGSKHDEDAAPRPRTPKYEEYEQPPPSPWSQSPAPSPAIRADPTENPFFIDVTVDEESFNPGSVPQDYTGQVAPETIGVDNSWTVLHIPLIHPLLSKPSPAFRLDPTVMEQKSSSPRHKSDTKHTGAKTPLAPSPDPTAKRKATPIAILSVLSPVIPYPSNLRRSIEQLAPHMATSFSLCRHYSKLEAEISGMNRRRPDIGGFGAIGPDGRPLPTPADLARFGLPAPEDVGSQQSLAGSITSPSDYSGPSVKFGSPAGTPGWEPSVAGLLAERRAAGTSPSLVGGDSYFTAGATTSSGRSATTPGGHRPRRDSKDLSSVDKRAALRIAAGKAVVLEPSTPGTEARQPEKSAETAGRSPVEGPSAQRDRRSATRESKESHTEPKAPSTVEGQLLLAETPRKSVAAPSSAPATTGQQTPYRHSQLHSYGGDFATSFPALPQSSTVAVRGVPLVPTPSRSASLVNPQVDMAPPSDRLKGLLLDSLPVHIFVAMPQTGAVVWVNSRYLSYRGQTAEGLAEDPWASIHPEDRDDYLKAWSHSVRTGEQFSRTVRIRRFDNAFRWFQARAVASRDKRNSITQFLGSYMDIHDQHIAELKAARQQEVEASEAKHRLLANLIPQIIFTATEDEGITFANEQWLWYSGQTFEESLGLGFMDFVHPDDLAKCRIPVFPPAARPAAKEGDPDAAQNVVESAAKAVVRQALSRNSSSGSSSGHEPIVNELTELAKQGVIKVTTDSSGRLSYTTELRLRSKDGEYRWHLIRCVEIDNIDFGNGASSYFGSATDINDLKLLEAKLKEAMDSKGRFLSNMSHEIRTPLIGISGMVSFLQDTPLNEEQRDYTNTIHSSAKSLLLIINDILDLSKVDAGMMKLSFEWFHPRSLIEDVNELVWSMATQKRLELNYVVESEVPAWIKGDKVRIRQVLLNVIGNAIKFTARGEVFSRCRVLSGGDLGLAENEIMLEFSVTDTGRGFSKEEAELIFKPFSQIDASSTRQHGGSGLGLVISRQLVELHGGKMSGAAEPGKGSTFTFSAKFGLPTDEDRPDAPLSPKAASPPQPYPEELGIAQPFRHSAAAARILRATPTVSPEAEYVSPALASSGSSDPSVRSSFTQATERSSISSVNVGLAHFSEAARVSGQDLSQMKLEIPSDRSSPDITPTQDELKVIGDAPAFRPPMYSILIVCPQKYSREATARHIDMTLPKEVPRQITSMPTVAEAEKFIGGEDPVVFTHIVINLPSPEEIVGLVDLVGRSTVPLRTEILILSDTQQRQAVMKLAAGTRCEELLSEQRTTYIYKPIKPSRFAVIFDPAKERDLSIDRNRSSAQRLVESQKQNYLDMEKRMGNKGHKVLLVEDNPINQKVLQKYLKKVGVEVEVAMDGVECTDKVFAQAHGYYALILCDLHMPRKDGYQACREIRHWEHEHKTAEMPIIALSANVMSDVQEKCIAAGFSDYVTKPVDFIDLSRALSKFF